MSTSEIRSHAAVRRLAQCVAELCDDAEATRHSRRRVAALFGELGLPAGLEVARIRQEPNTVNRAEATVVHHLGAAEQKAWVHAVRMVVREAPLVAPTTPGGKQMRVRVSAAGCLGWTGEGDYRYLAQQRSGRPWPALPDEWRALATRIAGEHPWDSAVVNWYDGSASLGWHADKAEHDSTLPVVTVSLGDSCSWAVRDRAGDAVSRCVLTTGAVTLLAGHDRALEHTVERIVREPLFSPLSTPGRVSVSIRVAGAPAETSQR